MIEFEKSQILPVIGLPDPEKYPNYTLTINEPITLPKILLLPEKLAHEIDFCELGIDETLGLTDMSSGILRGIIVGIVVGYVLIKGFK